MINKLKILLKIAFFVAFSNNIYSSDIIKEFYDLEKVTQIEIEGVTKNFKYNYCVPFRSRCAKADGAFLSIGRREAWQGYPAANAVFSGNRAVGYDFTIRKGLVAGDGDVLSASHNIEPNWIQGSFDWNFSCIDFILQFIDNRYIGYNRYKELLYPRVDIKGNTCIITGQYGNNEKLRYTLIKENGELVQLNFDELEKGSDKIIFSITTKVISISK